MISTSAVKTTHTSLPSNRTMKELLSQLAAYNTWANHKLLEIILALPEEKQKQEVPSSFRSLYTTVFHMWDAESIWWQRMKLHERITRPSDNLNSSMKDVSNGLLQQNQQWQEWVDTSTEPMLDHVFQYYSQKKESFKQPIFQMMLHVFNHGTYHRGQLVNMLRQLGIEKIPQTDFIVWSRKK
ncbi:MAG TPA: DinB family protein [Chitinophagaceae bacterium]|jgi:uncharacterized damage-inducible protein DinB|nr:DinB family protein [Chitinophagaceae bacterium]